jgi:transposase
LTPLLHSIELLTEEIAQYDREIRQMARERYPETSTLSQVWGVGDLTALTFVLTLEDPSHFTSSRTVGAFLGLVPRRDQSGETEKELRITKAGDALVRTHLVECAQRILQTNAPDTDLKRSGERIAARGGKVAKRKAVTAVARKLAVLLHSLWKTGEVYEPLRNVRAA